MTEQAQPSFDLRRVYLKDMSLEMPGAPAIFVDQAEPQIHIDFSINQAQIDGTIYQVEVKAVITVKENDKTTVLVEATQAGIFEIVNVPEADLKPLLGIACPSMLYPYLRSNVTDAFTRATLPPLYLTEINFEHIYQQQLAQEQGQ